MGMYNDDFNILSIDIRSLGNKLFCTFTDRENLEYTIDSIKKNYTILYNKIFVLSTRETNEFICTYNIDLINLKRDHRFLPNTIFTHRNKHTNTLYTINALNKLIMSLNDNKFDKNYRINWENYKNSIMLLRGTEFFCLHTVIYDVIKIN